MTIAEIRALTGLSAKKFGDQYGIPLRTVQNWEYGTNPAPKYVIDLLERVVKEDLERRVFNKPEGTQMGRPPKFNAN